MRCLFVCGAGVDRSPTAAFVAREIAGARGVELETNSLGLNGVLNNPTFKPEFDRYDKIFVMEEWMIEKIRERGYGGEVDCLSVDDNYDRGEPELIRIFRERLRGKI